MIRNRLRRWATKVAPTAYRKLQLLDERALREFEQGRDLEYRVRDLEKQLKELRQDNRRVVELYDAVIVRLREENPLAGE